MKLKTNWPYYLIHLSALVALLVFHRYTISSPDTAHYLFISRYYLEGDFLQAFNSHWSPLVSWLLVPFLALKVEPLLAFFILNALTSFVTLAIWIRLLEKADVSVLIKVTAILVAIPLMITGVVVLTPDFLTATLLLLYFTQIIKPAFGSSLRLAAITGLFGGLLFFSKSYSLPFFIVHFSALHFMLFVIKRYKKQTVLFTQMLKSYLVGMMTFVLVVTPWVLALSFKFGSFTYSNAGKYNIVNYGPEGGQHIYYNRLINPDTEFTRYDAFEEPSMFLTDWTPTKSINNFKYYLKRIGPNLSSLYYLSYLRDLGILIIISLFMMMFSAKKLSNERLILLLNAILVIGIYTSGYLLLLIKARYLWIDYFLGSLCLWILLAHLYDNKKMADLVRFWVITAGIILLINLQDMFRGYVVYRIYGDRLYALKEQVAELPLENKNVASNIAKNGMTHSAMNNLFRYYLKFRHWGHLVDERIKEDGLQQAYDNKLDYFFLWNGPDYLKPVFEDIPVILHDTTVGLTIYDLQNQKD